MAPKQKAKELYDKFYGELFSLTALRPRVAKQCALIAVDEMLTFDRFGEVRNDYMIIPYEDQPQWTEYWQQVKEALKQ